MPPTRHPHTTSGSQAPFQPGAAWRLEEAKARFSEVVRLARSEGPQHVTVRGREAVVVIAAEEFARLLPNSAAQQSLVSFLQALELGDPATERERDTGRDLDL